MDPFKHRSNINSIALWLLTGFMLRCALILHLDYPPVSDEAEYFRLAAGILNDGSFSGPDGPTAFRPPGYPFLLAGMMMVHPSTEFIRIVQSLMELLTAWLLLAIGREMREEHTGMMALAIWCCFPPSILMPGLLLSESAFTLLLTAGLFLVLRGTPTSTIALGVVSGFAVMMKPQAAVLVLAVIVWYAVRRKFRSAAVILIAVSCLTVPWMMRNLEAVGAPVLTTNGGVNFWIGNNPEATGGYSIPRHATLDNSGGELAQSKEGYSQGMEFITEHPFRTLVLVMLKAVHFWSPEHYLLPMALGGIHAHGSYKEQVLRIPSALLLAVDLPAVMLLMFGAAGFFLLPGSARSLRCMAAWMLILWMAAHLPFFGAARFHYPLLPLFAFASAAAIIHRRRFSGLPRRSALLLLTAAGLPGILYLLIAAALFL